MISVIITNSVLGLGLENIFESQITNSVLGLENNFESWDSNSVLGLENNFESWDSNSVLGLENIFETQKLFLYLRLQTQCWV